MISRPLTRYQMIRTFTGTYKYRCEETFRAMHKPCFAFASGECDHCGKKLCSSHKHKRVEFRGWKPYMLFLCLDCATRFDNKK